LKTTDKKSGIKIFADNQTTINKDKLYSFLTKNN